MLKKETHSIKKLGKGKFVYSYQPSPKEKITDYGEKVVEENDSKSCMRVSNFDKSIGVKNQTLTPALQMDDSIEGSIAFLE